MDESSWLHVDNYNTDLDPDFFDEYMASEWIEYFELPESIQADTSNAAAEEDAAILYNDDEIANSNFGNDREYLFTSSNRVSEASPQPDNVSTAIPLERLPAPVQLASNASPRRPGREVLRTISLNLWARSLWTNASSVGSDTRRRIGKRLTRFERRGLAFDVSS
jgi:hypothetical protein